MSEIRAALTGRASALMTRWGLKYEDLIGCRFAVNVFIATTIVWVVMKALTVDSPIWAIASMVAASEPVPEEARRFFRAPSAGAVSVACSESSSVVWASASVASASTPSGSAGVPSDSVVASAFSSLASGPSASTASVASSLGAAVFSSAVT